MLWVTRAGGNVDRVACRWLIKRFLHKDAQFLYVPADKVLETAKALGGRSYDARGAHYDHERTPEGEICTFVTIMRRHGLWGKDPALDEVAKVVNHADTSEATTAWKMVEAAGLGAIARGFALVTQDDHRKLEWEFPMYDALYAHFQKKLGLKGEA